MSEIGLGTAQLGGPSFIGGRNIGSPRIEREEAHKILETAYNAGINYYDTSDKYGDGESERILGDSFTGRRDKVIIATKCGITTSGNRCFEKNYVISCLEQSLKNLRTDYIDVFQLTKPDITLIKNGDIYEIFNKLKKEGKIRYSGVSTGTDDETERLILDNQIDSLQVFYNLLHIKPNEESIDKAYNANIALIIRSPLSSGILSGRYTYTTTFSEEDDRRLFLYGDTLTFRVSMVNAIIKRFKLSNNYDIILFSLNYLLSNSHISTIIPGVSKVEQLSHLLKVCHIKRMDMNIFQDVEDFIKTN